MPVQSFLASAQLWCSVKSCALTRKKNRDCVRMCVCVCICVYVCARVCAAGLKALPRPAGLTVVGHSHRQALLEAAVLALVAVLLLDLAAALALVVLQLQTDGPPKKTLEE